MRQLFILSHNEARSRAKEAVLQAPEGYRVVVEPPKRTLDQNAAQWPILEAISRQIQWPVNGEMTWLTDEEFKDVLTAAFKKQQPRLAAGVDGGVVMLGQHTKKFSKKEFSDWLEYLHWFCAVKKVKLDYEKS